MRKLLFSIVSALMLIVPAAMLVQPAFAQDDTVTSTTDDSYYDDSSYYYDDSYYDSYSDYYDSYYDYYGTTEDLATAGTAAGILGMLFGGVALIFTIFVSLAGYVYSGLTLMKIAQRLGDSNAWYAWIPILNLILLYRLGDQNPTLLLLLLIPGIGAAIVGIIAIIALMNICEKRGYDKALGLLSLVPIANLVLMGMLAWGKKEKAA